MNMKKYYLLLLLLLMLPIVNAALLGVNKVEVEYRDVLRGGYAEDNVIVSTGAINNISVYAEASGDIKEWVSFEPALQPLIMSANSPAIVRMIVRPPADAAVGTYEGKLLISTGPLGAQESNMGTNIVVAFEVKIRVIITDTQILSCNAGGFDLLDAEIGYPLEFSASAGNGGNVRVRPSFEIKVYDQSQKNLVTTLNYISQEDILPTLQGQIEAKLNHSLKEGQYWAEVTSPNCGSGSLITFSILEKGGISDLGEFVRIQNDAWAKTGEIVPISAQFRNRGTRVVSAQFKGIITNSENKIVKVLSSDKVDVDPDQLMNLELFFTPEEVDQYKIIGRVHYNSKITYEKSSMLNVEQGTSKITLFSKYKYYVVLVILLLIIVILIVLIIRKRRKKNKLQQ
ncbi:MAG: hypothetical protein ACP5N2_06175 [Candidatus Nanoarchaeia archaeon]